MIFLVKIIASIFEAIIIGLIVKYAGYQLAILTVLAQIYIQLLLKN